MDNDNSRKAAMLRNLAIMIQRLNIYNSQVCGELDCRGIWCVDCVFGNRGATPAELNEIADILDGKDV